MLQSIKSGKLRLYSSILGNLPYTATDDSIRKHFAKVHPDSIRHRSDRISGKSKGCAFLEFEAYDRMKTCLKLYHQRDFDDGVSPARKLNVELTYVCQKAKSGQGLIKSRVGGGGAKSNDRKSKLRSKNDRLNEQRKRRLKEEAINPEKVKKRPRGKGATNPEGIERNGDIHPSRRSRLIEP